MTHIYNKFIEWVDFNGAQIRNGFIFIQLLCSVRLCQFSHIYPLMISLQLLELPFTFIYVISPLLVITIYLQML